MSGRKPLTVPEISHNSEISDERIKSSVHTSGWSLPDVDFASEQQAIREARDAGFVRQNTRMARLRGVKDERQRGSKNLQIRTFEKQEEVLDWIQSTYRLKSRKETFDALLAITLLWAEEGREITNGMMTHFIAKDFTNI